MKEIICRYAIVGLPGTGTANLRLQNRVGIQRNDCQGGKTEFCSGCIGYFFENHGIVFFDQQNYPVAVGSQLSYDNFFGVVLFLILLRLCGVMPRKEARYFCGISRIKDGSYCIINR